MNNSREEVQVNGARISGCHQARIPPEAEAGGRACEWPAPSNRKFIFPWFFRGCAEVESSWARPKQHEITYDFLEQFPLKLIQVVFYSSYLAKLWYIHMYVCILYVQYKICIYSQDWEGCSISAHSPKWLQDTTHRSIVVPPAVDCSVPSLALSSVKTGISMMVNC